MSPEETEAIEVLKELVRVRKLRDKIVDGSASFTETKRYRQAKIFAWHRAFLAVARLP